MHAFGPFESMGIRQKLGLQKEKPRPKPSKTGAFCVLKRWFKSGKLSAGDVKDAANTINSESGQSSDPSVNRLARAGRVRGDRKPTNKNMSRDVMRAMTSGSTYPDYYTTSIVLWDSDMDCKITEDIHYLVPYEVADWTIGENGDVSSYTSLAPGSPFNDLKAQWMRENQIPGDGSDVVVCGLWGDAAPFFTRDSILMIIFNIISGFSNTRHWIGAWSKRMTCQCGCQGRCTFDSMFRFLVWVATAWMTKVFPSVRDDGVKFSASKHASDKKRAEWGRQRKHMKTRGDVFKSGVIGHGISNA